MLKYKKDAPNHLGKHLKVQSTDFIQQNIHLYKIGQQLKSEHRPSAARTSNSISEFVTQFSFYKQIQILLNVRRKKERKISRFQRSIKL